ncbi:MAG: thioredoxin domain-containing protein [Rothia sp. (in: high G+C Gram-positive bacteria)]|nr:thioredoxin domain-containing protein [Rothia sp. (in: high G+C Gram-positive bacteria)]
MARAKSAEELRERARRIAQKQSKATNGGSAGWVKATVFLVVAAIMVIIGVVVVNSNRGKIEDAGPVPASSNEYGGIVMTADGIVKDASSEPSRDFQSLHTSTASYKPTEGAEDTALPLGISPAEEASKNGKPVRLVVFQDFNCVHCAEFETESGEEIKKLVDEGKVELEIRNLTYLDSQSATKYSARAANAAYAVANQVSADQYLEFQKELFSHQGQGGLKDQEIIDIAAKYGADISADMKNNSWRSLVNVVTAESSANGVQGTPTVFADGQQFTTDDFKAWIDGIIAAKEKQ